MAAFACIGLLIVSSDAATRLMEDVIKDETIMQTYTEAERDRSIIDLYALPAFRVLVANISIKEIFPNS